MKTKKDTKKDKSNNEPKCPYKTKCNLYMYKDNKETITQCKSCNKIINIE